VKDIQNQLAKLENEIADCELIARMAVDPAKRELFNQLVEKYSELRDQLRTTVHKLDAA